MHVERGKKEKHRVEQDFGESHIGFFVALVPVEEGEGEMEQHGQYTREEEYPAHDEHLDGEGKYFEKTVRYDKEPPVERQEVRVEQYR